MTQHTFYEDVENLPNPTEGFLVPHFITVRSLSNAAASWSASSVPCTC